MSLEEQVTSDSLTGENVSSAKSVAGEEISREKTPAAEAQASEPTAVSQEQSPSAAATQAPEAGVTAESTGVDSGRKVQLNPTVDESVKAVPSISADAADSGKSPQALSAEAVPGKGPVDIPKVESLDADLESQLNAALAGSQSASANERPEASAAAGIPRDESELEPGTRLKGKVESVDDENVIVALGYRASGILSRRHYPDGKLPEVGAELEVVVESVKQAEGIINLGLLRSAHRAASDWDNLAVGQVVECTVQKTNKGGLDVQVGQLRGFMPAGQVDLYFVGDLEPFVGQKLTARVTDINPKKRNLVVSRKSLLQEERQAVEEAAWEKLAVGDQCTGTVKTLKDYGAFIDIGGVDGLLHVRELSWTRVNLPSDVLQEGQKVEVKILSIDREKKKISLGMKQLVANPWDYAEQKYAKNSVVTGIVKKLTEFGAFVEIEPGLEGLIHVSELDHKRINHVREVLQEGQETEAQVLEINKNKKRISLSLKSLKAKPQPTAEELAAQQADEAEEQRQREAAAERRKTLKGGTGGGAGIGLFGNPSDY